MARTKSHTRKTKSGLARVKSYVRKNKGKAIGMALGTGVSIGALVLATKKRKGKLGSPSNPVVQIPKATQIPERSSFQSRVKKTFTDATGKLRKKGQVMPGIRKGQTNTKVIQEPSPGFKQTIAIEAETVRPGVRYELNRPKPLNLKKKG